MPEFWPIFWTVVFVLAALILIALALSIVAALAFASYAFARNTTPDMTKEAKTWGVVFRQVFFFFVYLLSVPLVIALIAAGAQEVLSR